MLSIDGPCYERQRRTSERVFADTHGAQVELEVLRHLQMRGHPRHSAGDQLDDIPRWHTEAPAEWFDLPGHLVEVSLAADPSPQERVDGGGDADTWDGGCSTDDGALGGREWARRLGHSSGRLFLGGRFG